jgi:hypothetical protein
VREEDADPSPSLAFFYRIKSILVKDWFYNDLTKDQAYSALLGEKHGSFVVRISK